MQIWTNETMNLSQYVFLFVFFKITFAPVKKMKDKNVT